VEKLLADPQVAEAMGAAGRARLEQRFDTAKTVDQLIDALHEVAARAV
jgi:glycosyltransferase involved in cell wall biosynthesis